MADHAFRDSAACQVMGVAEAISTRRSIRAFLPTPVPRSTVEDILRLARRAPSGSNTQPWQVWVVAGATRDRLVERLKTAHEQAEAGHEESYPYYPADWFEPLLQRRRVLGKALYTLVDVPKGDTEAMKRQEGRNYEFFGAPVGLFVTVDRRNGQGALIDTGAFLQSVMIAARGFGLHTCPQQSFAKYHRLICEQLSIPDGQMLLCGMALGFADEDAPVNRLASEREPLESFVRFFWSD